MFTEENKPDCESFNELIRKIKKDAQTGLNEFYNIYGKLIYRVALNICKSHDIADEILNTVLLNVWKASQGELAIKNPKGWIYIITVNKAKDYLKREQSIPLNESISADKDNIQKLLDEDAFESQISCLSEYEKSIMIRRFVCQETFKEMSETDGKPLSTITTIYYRCLEKIEINLQKNKKS